MARTSVGVLRGGPSSEYGLSLKTGAAMLAELPDDRYETRDILVDKQGYWHLRGMPVTPARALSQIDVVLNAMHGGVGEDGTVQRILERSGVPYAGSRALPASLALNKVRAREVLQRAGIRMPRALSFTLQNQLTTGEMAQAVFSQFGPPYMVKAPSEGSSAGIIVVATLHALPDAIGDILDAYGSALVEEYIRGKEATVGIIEQFRNEELYALPPAHVRLPEGALHVTRSAREDALVRHDVPSRFTDEEKHALIHAARLAHRALGLSHFSDADLLVTPRSVYLLEINAHPGLHQGAAFPYMLESVGSSVREFLEHAINLARRR